MDTKSIVVMLAGAVVTIGLCVATFGVMALIKAYLTLLVIGWVMAVIIAAPSIVKGKF